MKNPGTPAIDDSSPKGSEGVSADGSGARLFARTSAGVSVVVLCLPAAEPAPGLLAGVLPCACWA